MKRPFYTRISNDVKNPEFIMEQCKAMNAKEGDKVTVLTAFGYAEEVYINGIGYDNYNNYDEYEYTFDNEKLLKSV